MIIISFPGINTSTLTRGVSGRYLELDTSLFRVRNTKIKDWETPYARVAEYLSRKGFDVFVSSHSYVCSALSYSSEMVIVCLPSESLKIEWVKHLKELYKQEKDTKDVNTIQHAMMHYVADVRELSSVAEEYQFPTIVLQSMEYDLGQELQDVILT